MARLVTDEDVRSGARPVDIRAPPADVDAFAEWLDRVSERLVLLEPYSLEEVRGAVHAVVEGMRRHLDRPPAVAEERLRAELAEEHARYRTSLEEVQGLLRVIESDDHGGHRQALGQYGRVLAESLRAHRARERAVADRPTTAGSRNSN